MVLAAVVNIEERKRLEERFRVVVEASPSGIVMVDADGRIVLINAQAERMFLYDRAELLGQPLEVLVPERMREGHFRLRTAFLAGPTVRAMGAGRDLRGRRRDGSEFPLEIGCVHTRRAQDSECV